MAVQNRGFRRLSAPTLMLMKPSHHLLRGLLMTGLALCGTDGLTAADWQDGAGHRSAALPLSATGHTGFTLLPPLADAIGAYWRAVRKSLAADHAVTPGAAQRSPGAVPQNLREAPNQPLLPTLAGLRR